METLKIRTNSKSVKEQMKKHIFECVLTLDGDYFTDFELLKNHVKNEFERVANNPYNLKRIPNEQERFSDYLNGIPFNFHYYFDDMNEFLNSLGINPNSKKFSDKETAKRYHYLIFKQIF